MEKFYCAIDRLIQELNSYFEQKVKTDEIKDKKYLKQMTQDMIDGIKNAAEAMDYNAFEYILKEMEQYSFEMDTESRIEEIREAWLEYAYERLENIAKGL